MKEILTPIQLRTVKEMLENVEKNYIPLIEDDDKIKVVKSKYSSFRSSFISFISDMKEDIRNKTYHNKSLLTPKIDPYIAGGASSSIAGVVGGVSAAVSTSVTNSNIDSARNYWGTESIGSTIAVNSSTAKLLKNAEELDKLLNEFPKIVKKREEVKEEDYQKALLDYKTFSFKKVKNSETVFKGLADYSNSSEMAIKATNKKGILKFLFYHGLSLLTGIVLPIIIGATSDSVAFVSLVAATYVIMLITLKIQVKLR